ncbi:CMRF35-like molecule 8 [Ictalurus punctatus]|uniref:CMRF35-like molecule 8 n=1 Tax=Ictalurus punctatus TaxID=7998 RepID=A0A9F7RMM6_ICTPU|nr:CMRF35-like molecule 8 [Ictalurus punctatus]
MKILLIFTLCLISDGGASKNITGYSGGGVFIKCKYHTEYTEKQKYFCKGSVPGCSDQIKTGAKNEWINSGRFSLFDDTKSAEFSVKIRELTGEDTGTYQCGVDISWGNDIYTPVELKVKKDLSYEKSISKTVHVGGDLNISCKYPQSFRRDPKFLCKTRLQRAACSYKASVKESRKYVNEGKFSLYDDGETQMFTVSIRNVTEKDSGEYWCGAEAAWTSDHGYKVYFTQINLTVTEPRVPVSASIPTQPSSLSESTPSSPPAGFPVSTVITVSVILLLLLIAIIFLTLTLQKRCRGTASTGRSSVQGSGNNQGVPLDDCYYEEIKDTRRLPASDEESSTIYSTAQLPTILSDPQTVYSNTELPTILCDSAVYSTAQRPTIPSDQDIYSTAHLPTRLSAEKSDEGLT